MEVRHQASHIAGGIGAACGLVFGLKIIHTGPRLLIPVLVIPLIHAIYLSLHGDSDVLMGKEKLPYARIQGEAMDPVPCGVHHDGTRAVYEIAGSHLLNARLKRMTEEEIHIRLIAFRLVNTKYGPNAHVHINIGGAV